MSFDRFGLCRSRPLFARARKSQPTETTDNAANAFQKKAPAKYVPFIPPQLVTETFNFLNVKSNIKALLDIICSPLKPTETVEQREEYTREWEVYKERRRVRHVCVHRSSVSAIV